MASARAFTYDFFSDLLSKPITPDALTRLTGPETAGFLVAMLPDKDLFRHFKQPADACEKGIHSIQDLLVDFEALMRVPGCNYLHPFESCYLEKTSGRSGSRWGPLAGVRSQALARIFEIEGVEIDEAALDFPDHIAAELAFMGHLCRSEVLAIERKDESALSLACHKQQLFSREHLSQWVMHFTSEMKRKARTDVYRGIAEMLSVFMVHENTYLIH